MKKAITRRRLMELTAAFAASSAVAHSVQAQAYPNRTIRLIAPFPAGGGTDSAARIIAARLSELLGQQVMVDNRPGAGSNIGAEAVARSAPDGYTLLLAARIRLSTLPALCCKPCAPGNCAGSPSPR